MRFVFIIGACVVALGWAVVELWLLWATRGERAAARDAAAVAQRLEVVA